MAEFSQKRGKRHDDDMLGSAVNFLLANARLVLGVGGAAVLGIATLAVKRLIDRAASSQDEDDAKAEPTSLEDSWKELSLLKATARPQPRPSPAAPSQPVLLPVPSLFAPGEWHPFPSNLGVPCGGHTQEMQPRPCHRLTVCPVQALSLQGCGLPACFMVCFLPSANHWDMWTLGVISQ